MTQGNILTQTIQEDHLWLYSQIIQGLNYDKLAEATFLPRKQDHCMSNWWEKNYQKTPPDSETWSSRTCPKNNTARPCSTVLDPEVKFVTQSSFVRFPSVCVKSKSCNKQMWQSRTKIIIRNINAFHWNVINGNSFLWKI